MKFVIPGGSGQLGSLLTRKLESEGHQVVSLSRRGGGVGMLGWDGRSLGPWADEIDGCDVVINLAGRSVDCRYTEANLREMMDSRVESTRVVGQAIQRAVRPPAVWLQMSTATIYAHTFGDAHGESGVLGGEEPNAPAYWRRSIDIAKAWEDELAKAETSRTRKVALRTAMVMDVGSGGVFDVLSKMVRFGLGGAIAGGRQYVSWIHEEDFVRALLHLVSSDHLEGPFNLASPDPRPQAEFMRVLRNAWRMPIGLPATAWMAEIGAFVLRTDTELLLKSRRVIPQRLQSDGFAFRYGEWREAAEDLVERARAAGGTPSSGSRESGRRNDEPDS